MNKKILFFLSFGIIFLLLAKNAQAVSVDIISGPADLTDEQEFNVEVSVTGSSIAGRTYYLEAAFTKKDASTSYFGWTQNDKGGWFKHASGSTNFFQITMSPESTWSGSLRGKPDLSSDSFKGQGEYWLKIIRHTDSGPQDDDAGSNDNNKITVYLNHQEPSPSSNPSPSPEEESNPSPSPSPSPSPASITTTSKSPSPKPTVKPSPKPSPSPSSKSEEDKEDSGQVMGAQTSPEATISGTTKTKKQFFTLPVIFIISGTILMLGAAFPFVKPKIMEFIKRRKNPQLLNY